jgi:excinuclease ABC subunit C
VTAPAAPSASAEEAARFEQVLSPIAGVGPAKRTAIYNHFGTYRKLRAATPEKLAEVPGISRTLADRIHNTLHSK